MSDPGNEPIVVYYVDLGLSKPEAVRFQEAMETLPDTLRLPPLRAELACIPLPEALRRSIEPILLARKPLACVNADIGCCGAMRSEAYGWKYLVVGCGRDSPLLACHPTGVFWGTALPGGPLAVCWKVFDKYIVWHEVLHLFGVDDCYELGPPHGTTCELPNCIMQYEPTTNTVVSWPFLCTKALDKLRKRFRIPLA